jgi:hypothetical protein
MNLIIKHRNTKHKRNFILTTSGGYHFYAGDVYDDLLESLTYFHNFRERHDRNRQSDYDYRIIHLGARARAERRLADLWSRYPRHTCTYRRLLVEMLSAEARILFPATYHGTSTLHQLAEALQ